MQFITALKFNCLQLKISLISLIHYNVMRNKRGELYNCVMDKLKEAFEYNSVFKRLICLDYR